MYSVYILYNKFNTVNYTGVTNNLVRRHWEHKSHENKESFTARYKVHKLVYYEDYDHISDAIAREKQIKGLSRNKKLTLIRAINPDLKDLSLEWPEFQLT